MSRRELLARQQHGRMLKPRVVARVAQTLEREPETFVFTDLHASDELDSIARARLSDERTIRRRGSREQLTDLLKRIVSPFARNRVFVLLPESHYVGAVVLDGETLMRQGFELVTLDQDDVVALTDREEFVVSLSHATDWDESGPNDSHELHLWLPGEQQR